MKIQNCALDHDSMAKLVELPNLQSLLVYVTNPVTNRHTSWNPGSNL